ncbi:MAG: alanine/glycine:cation symporter family protein [Bacteroidota bacterium]
MQAIEQFLADFSGFAWGPHLLVLLIGGGLFFIIYIRFLPYKYFGHAIDILRGKYDDPNEEGQLTHYEALSTAIAATVGMGNISGVAVAITMGGPGALVWMWISALIGICTKFFTCTLAIMYRGKDSQGETQGGPMYVIVEGLGKKWKPLALFFSVAGLFGALPAFQANQLTATISSVLLEPNGVDVTFNSNLITGIIIAIIVSAVIFGGIKRIGSVAARLVPVMVAVYVVSVLFILIRNIDQILPSFQVIFEDAFSGNAVLGGALGALIIMGVRRAAFSNEAGIGTAPMAHGAAKTNEPVREGLIAMLGPVIDTIIVCTMTALAIIITGVWEGKAGEGNVEGITVTIEAFEQAMPGIGSWVLMACVLIFSFTTLFSFSYYGTKCLGFLAGAEYQHLYNYFYVFSILISAVVSLSAVINLIDGFYGLMAIPTMVSALLLAPKVRAEARAYIKRTFS